MSDTQLHNNKQKQHEKAKSKTRDRQSISMHTPGIRKQAGHYNKSHVSFKLPHSFSAPTSRTLDLSHYKPVPIGFFEDRRSVYWNNNMSEKDYTKTTMPQLTSRWGDLSLPKELHTNYIGDRPSPIWTVSNASQTHTPSKRTESLASSKTNHSNYMPCRTVETVIPDTALTAKPSKRISTLSQPKSTWVVQQHTLENWGQPAWTITQAARHATASSHLDNLANHKIPPEEYSGPRDVIWKVSQSTKRAVASEQVVKLSLAKSYNLASRDYNPNAWTVSEGAKRATASAHTISLATPIARKQRQKLLKAT